MNISGANNDVKAHVVSGPINVSGNPSDNRRWELKTVSGLGGYSGAAIGELSAFGGSHSGDIRTSIPVIIEEQNKHSLRAHVGSAPDGWKCNGVW